MGKSYAEKLKDPRWRKKRVEILIRDDYHCQNCGGAHIIMPELRVKNIPLEVHHLLYFHGRDPWEYDNDNLVTLCKWCHGNYHRGGDLDCAVSALLPYNTFESELKKLATIFRSLKLEHLRIWYEKLKHLPENFFILACERLALQKELPDNITAWLKECASHAIRIHMVISIADKDDDGS